MNFLIDATWNFVPSALILVSFPGCHVWAESGNETKSVICDRSQMLNVTEKLGRRLCKVSDKSHVS